MLFDISVALDRDMPIKDIDNDDNNDDSCQTSLKNNNCWSSGATK